MPKYVNIPLCKSLEQKEEREQGEEEVGEKAASEHLPSFARPKMNEILDDKHDDNDKNPANATSISRTIQNNSRGRQQKPQSEAIFHQGAMTELENENASNLDKGQSEARDANEINATPTNFSTLANATSISPSIQNNHSGQQQPQQPQSEAVFHQAAGMTELENENAAVLDALNLDKDQKDPKMNEILDDKQDDSYDDFDKMPANATSTSAPIQNNSRGGHQQPQFEAVFHQPAAMTELDNENAAVLDALNLDKDHFDDVYEVSRPVGAKGTGSVMAAPDFGKSANPISTKRADYANLITTGPPEFSKLPTALVSAEDEPIVAAAEDKNPGEVVAVAEANSLNEAVKLLKRPTTIEPGKVCYLATV